VKRIGAKEAGDGSVIKRIAGGRGDLSVSRDAALRDGADDEAECVVTQFVGARGVLGDSKEEFGWSLRKEPSLRLG
jgi:hypothetical protein